MPDAADAEPTCAGCGASLAGPVAFIRKARAGALDRLERPQPSFARERFTVQASVNARAPHRYASRHAKPAH